jgi:hypothetical protein
MHTENPYESPGDNSGKAKYDHSIFWLAVRVLLWIGAILLAIDLALSGYMHFSRTVGADQIGDVPHGAVEAVQSVRDWLRSR